MFSPSYPCVRFPRPRWTESARISISALSRQGLSFLESDANSILFSSLSLLIFDRGNCKWASPFTVTWAWPPNDSICEGLNPLLVFATRLIHKRSFLFDNAYLFFVISLISILLIINILKINFNNILLLLILILSNPQLTIYHKYYDPLLLILFFLFFDFKFPKEKIINKRVLYNIYIFYSFLLCINFGRYFFNY